MAFLSSVIGFLEASTPSLQNDTLALALRAMAEEIGIGANLWDSVNCSQRRKGCK
jgi:hypothetical protein